MWHIKKSPLFNEKEQNKIKFSIIKQVFIVLWSLIESLACNQSKFLFLNDESCMVRPTYLFMISLDQCTGSCNVLSRKECVWKKRNKRHKC